MSAVQIAGCSAAGKTTMAAALARRGLAAIDSDDDPLLARMVDAAGHVVEEQDEPAEPDLAWLSRHSWAWDPARLDELIRGAAPATLYVCGGADNQQEIADRFTAVFLLEIDEATMLARIDAREDNDWDQIGDTREYLRRKLPRLQDRLRAAGAIAVDARQPLDQVVDAILRVPVASRLTFREMTEADLDDLAALLGDEDVMRFYPRPRTRGETRDWIARNQRRYRDDGFGLWIIGERDSGAFVGDCGLTIQRVDGVDELEVGYHVRTGMQGRGYATEAAAAARDFARDVLSSSRLTAIINPLNLPSRRVAAAIGLTEEKRAVAPNGTEAVIYAAALWPRRP